MRKYTFLFALLAVLAIAGVALAHSISTEPYAANGQANIVVPVYTASALDVGDVVVYAAADSTGDNDLWVKTTTSADTSIVAGVVWPSAIAAGNIGQIVIWGFAECDVVNSSGENGEICTSTTAGSGDHCTTKGTGYAFTTAAVAAGGGQAGCFVKVK